MSFLKRLGALWALSKNASEGGSTLPVALPAPTVVRDLVTEAVVSKMFRSSFFSICDVDKLLSINRENLCLETREVYDYLRALHCVHYRDMPRELVKALPELVARVVYPDRFIQAEVVSEQGSTGIRISGGRSEVVDG